MAKISNTVVYPETTPTLEDYVIITDQDTEDLETKTCTLATLEPVVTNCNMDVRTAAITLNLAELQNLHCAPKLLAEAPGPDKAIKVISQTIYVKPGLVPFNGAVNYWRVWVGVDPQCVNYSYGVPPYTVPETCLIGLRGGECYPYTDPPTYMTAPGWDVPYMNCCGSFTSGILGTTQLRVSTPTVFTAGLTNATLAINSAVYFWQRSFYSAGTPTEGDGFVGVSIKYQIMDYNCL